ncbi:TetR/AcrR family transcriptional regulator [Nocardia sp. CA-129566]|uniref:TetR/AcrR family transcriptional regulator n=1 Tax=Nocardia sp. CA-129566 TaxID=3239976 RepID=UPI003D961EE2
MAKGSDVDDSVAPRTGGRIRSRSARDAVLRAAAELLEEQGFGKVTIEGVAARSGVAKSTIYRWWKSKATLVMDAQGAAVTARMPDPDTGSAERDLTVFLEALYGVVNYPLRVEALRGLMAQAQLDPDFAEPFRAWVQTRRDVVVRILNRGVMRGELAADLDVEYATDLIFGPFWYRLLVAHAPLQPEHASADIARLLSGFRAPG